MKKQLFLHRWGDILVQVGKDKQQLVCVINTVHESKLLNLGKKDRKIQHTATESSSGDAQHPVKNPMP
jgi:hypothetical protein